MNFDGQRWADSLHATGGFFLSALPPGGVAASIFVFDTWVDALPLALSFAAIALSGIAIYFAVRARQLGHSALQEAGEAKARAQATGPALSSEALAATERVWTARLNAIEAQIQSNPSRPPRPGSTQDHHASELATRMEEIEKKLNGLSNAVAQGRRNPSSPPMGPLAAEVKWPAVLKIEKQGIKELRDLLQEGGKTMPAELEKLFQKLNEVDGWSAKRRPSLSELLSFLSEVSQSFHAVVQQGASLPAHEASRMSDRLAGLLRPLWQKYHPGIDCRIFYPGAPFDPEWMEDQNSSGLRRPTISDIFSWAVHEKHPSGRRLMAKSRVTTE